VAQPLAETRARGHFHLDLHLDLRWRVLQAAGTATAPSTGMPRNIERNPSRYDDIVRKTVIDPDSSTRPTREQEQEAREGFRALDPDEQVLHDRVQQALAGLGGASKVSVEVSGELVTLYGQVGDLGTLRALEDAVARVTGVETIHNQVVVAAP
jgi:hypothetical protein